MSEGGSALRKGKSAGWLQDGLARLGRWLGVRPLQLVCLGVSLLLALMAAALAAGSATTLSSPILTISVWALGIGLAIAGGLRNLPRWKPLHGQTAVVVVLLIVFAFLLRGVDTTHIPVTLTGDEAEVGLNAAYFAQGQMNNLFGSGWHGFPGLYFYLQSLFVSVWGQTIPALRIPSAIGGALTVGAVYLAGRAMFGQRTGLAAAIYLAAFHFHIHFSRLGLNNIWDGLGYIVTLGALWYAWRTNRRAFFLLAGLGWGFAQYFYYSGRLLFILIPLWLMLASWMDKSRLKRALPDLLLMTLAMLVVVLPLAWFYAQHPDTFFGPIRAQSIFGHWMTTETERTGQSSAQILFSQIGLGLKAYVLIPIQWFYRPFTPILRPMPAILFGLGIVFLGLRPRDTRFHLLGLWLLAIGLAGGLSESTPAAQRYVAAAPACALLVGYGLVRAAAFLRSRVTGRAIPWVGALTIALVAFISADDLRFYYLEYTPNSHFRGKYDFEGYGAAVATRLAAYLQGFGDQWQVQFFGSPRLNFHSIPSIRYLAPAISGLEMPSPWGSTQNPQPSSSNQIYVFLEGREQDFASVRHAYSDGLWLRERDDQGGFLYDLYQYPRAERDDPPGWRLSRNEGLSQPTFLWASGFLIAAGIAVWLARRKWPLRAWLAETEVEPLRMAEAALSRIADAPTDAAASETQTSPTPAEAMIVSSPEESLPPEAPPTAPVAKVSLSVEVPIGATVQVTISALPNQPVQINQQIVPHPQLAEITLPVTRSAQLLTRSKVAWARWMGALRSRAVTLPVILFWLACLVYLLTRLVGLSEWPIYFFTDEAIQTNQAADLIRNNFRDRSGEFLPTFFENGNQYNLSLSVYVQVLPYLFFGKSVFVTRLISLLITLLGTAALGLSLREAFDLPYWWSGVLVLSTAPAWFLHSRTAFESVEATALYAGFLYLYLLYRFKSPRYLYLSLIFGALTFYTYSPAQLVVMLSGVLLLISDWRYHWQNRAIALRGLGLLVLLALPYVRFLVVHPTENTVHLKVLHSYWVQSLPLSEKLRRYITEYTYGLSPGYWFVPNSRDFSRHLMRDYGHLLRLTLPFAALGLGMALIRSLRQPRSSAYRLALIALLAAPAGGALAEIGITRVLFFVVPAALLTALGLSTALSWLEQRGASRKTLSLALFAALSLLNIAMTRDALVNGPTWYSDYTLGGMQYGARQIFAAIRDYHRDHPDTRIVLSTAWTNGTDEVARFFLPDPLPIQLGSIEAHMLRRLPLDDSTLFVMMPDEYQKAVASGKFADIRVEQTLPYPDGLPGFYFVRLRYVDNIDEILAAESESRRQPLEGELTLDGQTVRVRYSRLDMGEITAVFDGNPNTLIRSMEANPLVVDLTFSQPRALEGVSVRVGGTPTTLTVRVTAVGSNQAVAYSTQVESSVDYRNLDINFPTPLSATRLEIEVKNTHDIEPAHVHVWEIMLDPNGGQ